MRRREIASGNPSEMMPGPADIKLWLDFSHPALRILMIWVLAWLLLRLLHKLLHVLRTRTSAVMEGHLDPRRLETLSNVFRYAAEVVVAGLAVMLTLSEFGISIAPILATAGVAGIAIGFGAQSLVKDFFTGLFLLIENQVSEGDIIEAAGKSGFVERVTLRHIRIRDEDGSLHFIPNGMITLVTNRSRGFAYAVIDVNIPRSEDLDRVFAMMSGIVEDMRKDAALGRVVMDDLDIAGVEKLEDATVGVRCRLKVLPPHQFRIRREFLRRFKDALDRRKEPHA
jgi:small-conductance mechanosensitive channel